MTSIRHNDAETGPAPSTDSAEGALLDAARAGILAVGWKRTTLTDVARRAGVSRMTIYRRWPDMQTLLGDLMTREWSTVALGAAGLSGGDGPARGRIAHAVAATVAALRSNELFRKIVDVDPELLLPYLLDRRGRTQDALLDLLAAALAEGQADGSVRAGDPTLLARSLLLTAHGFALSAATMTAAGDPGGTGTPGPSLDDLDAELAELTDRYLAP